MACDIWRSGSAFVLINEVNLRRARLVLRWVTVSGFDSQERHFISVRNEPPMLTQPSTLRGRVKRVPAKGSDDLWLGVTAGMACLQINCVAIFERFRKCIGI